MNHKIYTGLALSLALSLSVNGNLGIPAEASTPGKAVRTTPTQASTGDIEINETNFPDPAFRNWLLQPNNLEGIGADGKLTQAELRACTRMVMKRQGVTDLTGINYFTAIKLLDVEGNHISQVDISQLSELETVYLRTNRFKQVDLSHNKKLKFIEIFDNQLESIDVSMLSELEFLHIDHNKLTTIDMSHNLKLRGGGFIVRNQPNLQTVKLPNIPGGTIDADNFWEQDSRAGYSTWSWQYQGQPERKIGPRDILPFDGSTLEVVRTPNPYRINFNPGASGVNGATSSIETAWDQEITLPEPGFTRPGYTFAGWKLPNTQVVSAGAKISNIGGRNDYNKLATITAVWKANPQPEKEAEKDTEKDSGTGTGTEAGTGTETGVGKQPDPGTTPPTPVPPAPVPPEPALPEPVLPEPGSPERELPGSETTLPKEPGTGEAEKSEGTDAGKTEETDEVKGKDQSEEQSGSQTGEQSGNQSGGEGSEGEGGDGETSKEPDQTEGKTDPEGQTGTESQTGTEGQNDQDGKTEPDRKTDQDGKTNLEGKTEAEKKEEENEAKGEETPENPAVESEAAANWRRERLAREIALAKAKAQLESLKLPNATRENYLQQLADAQISDYGQILAAAQKKAREARKRNLQAANQ